MSELTYKTKQRADKLNRIVDELKEIDAFRQSVKINKLTGLKVVSTSPNGSSPVQIGLKERFPELNDMFEAMLDAQFFKRQDEIQEILRSEYGGVYVDVYEPKEETRGPY